jgi:hypothetical protein
MLNNYIILPTLHVQFICTYSEQRIRKMAVSTMIIPLTKSVYHIYDSINYSVLSGLSYKIYLSSLRMEQSIMVRNKLVKAAGLFYAALKGFRKGPANFQSG